MDKYKLASNVVDRLVASGDVKKIDKEYAVAYFMELIKLKSFEKLESIADDLTDTAIINQIIEKRKGNPLPKGKQ